MVHLFHSGSHPSRKRLRQRCLLCALAALAASSGRPRKENEESRASRPWDVKTGSLQEIDTPPDDLPGHQWFDP